jgi:hypothetical protein
VKTQKSSTGTATNHTQYPSSHRIDITVCLQYEDELVNNPKRNNWYLEGATYQQHKCTVTKCDVKQVAHILITGFKGLKKRSQWPRGLKCRSSAARQLRLWIRIPSRARMFVVSVVCCQVEFSTTD